MIIVSQGKNKIWNFGEHDKIEIKKYTHTSYTIAEESHDEWRFEMLLTGWEDYEIIGTYYSPKKVTAVLEAILNAFEKGDRIFKMPERRS